MPRPAPSAPSSAPPPDPGRPERFARVRRAFDRAAGTFDEHAGVFDVVGGRLRERLEVLATPPTRILELGCRTGRELAALAERYPGARITGLDPAPAPPREAPSVWPRWLRRGPAAPARVAGDPHRLPFADGAFDLVVSSLLLPWCEAPERVFAEVARVLETGGALFLATAGPDTLVEYRRAWAAVDAHAHGFGLIDMHDLGDAMLRAGLAEPVLDRDDVTVDYPSLGALEAELRAVGATNLARGRRAGLTGPSARTALERAAPGGRFPVTLELVQAHGWKGEPRAPGGGDGVATISLEHLRRPPGRSPGR